MGCRVLAGARVNARRSALCIWDLQLRYQEPGSKTDSKLSKRRGTTAARVSKATAEQPTSVRGACASSQWEQRVGATCQPPSACTLRGGAEYEGGVMPKCSYCSSDPSSKPSPGPLQKP